MDYASL